jgi:hypothetical protein
MQSALHLFRGAVTLVRWIARYHLDSAQLACGLEIPALLAGAAILAEDTDSGRNSLPNAPKLDG